ncbi:MAG: 4-hydroxy-tetrahydrodipicolinate reductase [Alistipes sp.]|nr:4-hydroxy-tetrahydrodipicolinate reductase [Alistipes sp.]
MKCAIIGYGKMGREIERILVERGHNVELVIDEANAMELTAENIQRVDVAFEFTTPETGADNVAKVLAAGGRVVCGTTGWLSRFKEMETLADERGGALFYASNFSIGVNMMFRLNRRLAELMNPYPQYNVRISETHHIWKKDAPSGTAITLAEGIIENLDRKTGWVNRAASLAEELEIESLREGMVPGIHTITYTSADDFIELKHSITNRRALAMGAVLAGEYLSKVDKGGVYSMDDLL